MQIIIDGKAIPIPENATINMGDQDYKVVKDGVLLIDKEFTEKYATGGVIDKSKFPNGLFGGNAENHLHIEGDDGVEMVGTLENIRNKELSSFLTGLGIEQSKIKPISENIAKISKDIAENFQNDNVNHPNHYTQGGIECIDALKSATIGKKGIEAVCVANVIKYLWRYEEKNGLEDVKKSLWYLNRLIKEIEGGKNADNNS